MLHPGPKAGSEVEILALVEEYHFDLCFASVDSLRQVVLASI